MPDLAVEEIGDGGKPDMRVRADVERLPSPEDRRPHAVEEDEGPDQTALGGRQRAAHLEAANVLGAGNDHQLDRVAGKLIADFGIYSGEEAHGGEFRTAKGGMPSLPRSRKPDQRAGAGLGGFFLAVLR